MKKGWILFRIKGEDGQWVERSSHIRADEPDAWARADEILRQARDVLRAREDAIGSTAAVTVRAWASRWLTAREKSGVRDAVNDRSRIDIHVLPTIGAMLLEDVKPRHLDALAKAWTAAGKASRTRRNIYSVVKAMFRDAKIAGLLESEDPCILTHRQLGKVRDAKPGWRAEAVFGREELEQLIVDERIPQDRRVWYGLLGAGMLRTGEAAGLRFGKLQAAQPLARMVVDTSYDSGRTKTEEQRWMPVHPTLAALIAEWKLSGFARTFGRPPVDSDLVCPVPPELDNERGLVVAAFRAELAAARDRAGLSNRNVDLAVGTTNLATHWFGPSRQPTLPAPRVWRPLAELLGLGSSLDAELARVRAMPKAATHPKPAGSMRDKDWARKRFMKDLAALGFRHRRAHDLRRTGISLARSDGADRSILPWGTHAPPRAVFDLYTAIEWEALCREVAKLRVARKMGARPDLDRAREGDENA